MVGVRHFSDAPDSAPRQWISSSHPSCVILRKYGIHEKIIVSCNLIDQDQQDKKGKLFYSSAYIRVCMNRAPQAGYGGAYLGLCLRATL